MADHPLLFFPDKTFADPLPRGRGGKNLHLPSPTRQRDRLQPQFRALEQTFDSLQLQSSPLGLLPEQVLVLETIGSVEEFYAALKGLNGLDWIGDYEVE